VPSDAADRGAPRSPDPGAERRPDLVNRDFTAEAPDRLWVGDFTYLRCWEGRLFFSFIIDVFSRKIVGWQLASHMRTDLVLDALRMALGTRELGADFALVQHTDHGSQYLSYDYAQVLDDHNVLASVGSVGDAYDNALAESFVDTFKTELIKDRVWKTRGQLELAILEYVHWFNHDRLHESLDDIPPVELEDAYYAHRSTVQSKHTRPRSKPTNPVSVDPGPAQPLRCAPRCGTRTVPPGCGGLPVLDETLVGEFGLLGELAFLEVALFEGGGALGVLGAVPGGRAGAEFERAEFAVDDGLAFERVVLLGGEQLPAQAGKLAGGRHDRDLRAAAGAHALIERAERTGGLDGRPGSFAENVPAAGGALF